MDGTRRLLRRCGARLRFPRRTGRPAGERVSDILWGRATVNMGVQGQLVHAIALLASYQPGDHVLNLALGKVWTFHRA